MIPNANVRGDIYECLLSKLATDGVNGKFRTPRHIIRIMVDIMVPGRTDIIRAPVCGTSGFLVAAGKHLKDDRKEEIF